ncbi:MAG: GAF domain-containing protein, partial [Anaerolineae bacterium]|nr:GAF domain-containing protein [Anaerolineae bacterium]
AQGIRSFISMPLRAQGELVGAINFGAVAAGAFSPEDVVVMREVAHVLAIA